LIAKKLEKSRINSDSPKKSDPSSGGDVTSKYAMKEKGDDMIYITGEDVSPVEKGY
jgi:hypothetical protein